MIWSLLLMLWSPGEIRGDYWITTQANAFVIRAAPDKDAQPRRMVGRAVSILRDGIVFERDERLFYMNFADTQAKLLPEVDAVPLLQSMPNVSDPCFVDTQNIHVFRDNSWHRYDLPVWTEVRPLREVMNSSSGYRFLFPDLIQVSPEICWMYQAKTGVLTQLVPGSERSRREVLDRKLVPVVSGSRVLWIGAPKKDTIGLNRSGSDYGIVDRLEVKHLSRYALSYADDTGCWLLTFPRGLSDGLDAWNEGLLPITATRITVTGDKLEKNQVSLGSLPVSFALRASASGSPKLDVTPQFGVFPIWNSSDLVLLIDGQAKVLTTKGLGKAFDAPKQPGRAFRRDGKLVFQ